MKYGFLIFDPDDMRRTAFRTFSATHAAFFVKLGIRLQNLFEEPHHRLLEKPRNVAGEIQILGIGNLKRGKALRNVVAHKGNLIRLCKPLLDSLADHNDLHGVKPHQPGSKVILSIEIFGGKKHVKRM